MNKDLMIRRSCKQAVLWLILAASSITGCKADKTDITTLDGKFMCGYQGWFRTPDDGSNMGWVHYRGIYDEFKPGKCGIEFWPDVSELDEKDRVKTPFRHKDGSPAYVFSSHNPNVVDLHFKWMKEYGIDGAFLQRFACDVTTCHHEYEQLFPSNNNMLNYVRAAANHHGRSYALMYDLSSIPKGWMDNVKNDWKYLRDELKLLNDPKDNFYQEHNGKPIVGIWGVGFNDNREYTLNEVEEFMDFLKNDPNYGGCSIILGVPTYWRTLDRDTVSDKDLLRIIKKADVVMPWTIGRYRSIADVKDYYKNTLIDDVKWSTENRVDFLPVVFPGFSWRNLKPIGEFSKEVHEAYIPRLKGKFLWTQSTLAKKAGVKMIYQAMFDELDEGTQIFKVTNDPPLGGGSEFRTHDEGLPNDFYLKLAGKIRKMLRGEIPPSEEIPAIK
ncbi:MAG: glycoside hydrolase family 71/99-like protein [Verrucomicrobiota bacterium]